MEGLCSGVAWWATHPSRAAGRLPSPPPQPSRDGPSGGAPDSAGDTAFIWFAGRLLDGGVRRQSRQPWWPCPPNRRAPDSRSNAMHRVRSSGIRQRCRHRAPVGWRARASLRVTAESDRPARRRSEGSRWHVHHHCIPPSMQTRKLCPQGTLPTTTNSQAASSSREASSTSRVWHDAEI